MTHDGLIDPRKEVLTKSNWPTSLADFGGRHEAGWSPVPSSPTDDGHVGDTSFDVSKFVDGCIKAYGLDFVETQYRTFNGVRGRGDTVSEAQLGDALSGEIPEGMVDAVLNEIRRRLGVERVQRYPDAGGDVKRKD